MAHPYPERPYRLVYRELVGPIPEGYHLHHRCENQLCCNPNHLEPLSPAEHKRRHRRWGNTGATQRPETDANHAGTETAKTA